MIDLLGEEAMKMPSFNVCFNESESETISRFLSIKEDYEREKRFVDKVN